MPWTTKLLVIANRTVDSNELFDTLRARAAAGRIEVTLIAPADSVRAAAARRVERAVARLQAEDIAVAGFVGHPDPLVAAHEAWDPRRFDEVIVVTLPTDVSRWMTLDLPQRIERFTGARMTHVVAYASPTAAAGRRMQRARV